jgi:hydroxyacylglutathione hydrolase
MAALPPVHRVPAFTDNYVWLFNYAPELVAIVDPADAAPVMAAIDRLRVRPTHILNTHWHPDHVGGNLALKERFGLEVIGPAREAAKIPGLNRAVDEGDTVVLGDHVGEVLFVGAHTAGHIAFHFPSAAALFCGDTLFAMGCGRLFEGTAADMFVALAKLARLPADTRVFCAHEYTLSNARFAMTVEPGNERLARRYAEVQAARRNNQPTVPFALAEELATNPFVRAGSIEELAERRRAKDAF